MIKTIFVGAWVIVIFALSLTLGAGKFPGSDATAEDMKETSSKKAQHLQFNPISVPVIIDASVRGYLIVEPAIVFLMEAGEKNTPVGLFMQDAIVSHLFNNEDIDPDRLDTFKISSFSSKIKQSLNDNLIGVKVKQVLIQRLDYLTVEEVRDNRLRAG